jgi:hypothetical protein
MQSRWLFSSALAGCFALGWFSHVLTAQGRSPVTITRIYTGSDGQSHAEEMDEGKLKKDPRVMGLGVSEMIKVTGLQFSHTAPGWATDWHPADRHQYIVTLRGRGEIEIPGGQKIPLVPGSIVLAEDMTGKGHISRTIGTEERVALNIHIGE